MAARKAVVRTAGGLVENIIETDAGSTYTPPTGTTLVAATATAQINGTWDGTTFGPAPAPAPTPDPNAPKRARLAELRARGWANLTTTERAEAQQLVFEIMP